MVNGKSIMVKGQELSNTIIINSRIEEIGRVLDCVKTYMERKGYIGVKYRRLIGASYEAIANAIIHGNRKDEGKRVVVTYLDAEDQFQVRVRDEGEGFDLSSVRDPRLPENITKSYGRGIFIIRKFVDGLSFNDKGNEITLTIKK